MAVTASFNATTGVLTVFGDALDNNIVISRNAAGQILVNGGAVQILGGTPTVANVSLIQAFGQAGNDTITIDETNGAMPKANLFGGSGNDTLTGGSGNDMLFGQDGNDTLLGDEGNDQIYGGGERDWIDGGDGVDTLRGESGNDTLVGGALIDQLIGGPDQDSFSPAERSAGEVLDFVVGVDREL